MCNTKIIILVSLLIITTLSFALFLKCSSESTEPPTQEPIDLTGSWEEIWRSLESVEFFDIEKVVEYALILANATTAAKVGFFLEQHKEALMIDDRSLKPLRELRPRQPHYLMRGKRKHGRWIKDWNLMVPDEILNQSWGEVL